MMVDLDLDKNNKIVIQICGFPSIIMCLGSMRLQCPSTIIAYACDMILIFSESCLNVSDFHLGNQFLNEMLRLSLVIK